MYLGVSKDSVNHEMNVSRRLIQSEFLLDNLAQQKFTDYGMGTIPLDTTIIDRIKPLSRIKVRVAKVLEFQKMILTY